MSLKGRVAIISGASRGVGREVALTLAKEGCNIVVAAKSVEETPKLPGSIFTVAKEIEALGVEALPIQCDVRSTENIQKVVDETKNKFGKIDILVNNAGALWWQPMMNTPEKKFDLMMEVNAKATFFFCQAVLPSMIENKWGHIVNMSPPVDLTMLKNHIGYFISKYGMTMISHGLAEEMKSNNIAVNSLWPETMVESYATINWGLGDASMWRKASILADATLAIIKQEPPSLTGQALIDETFLRSLGVTDFEQYNCVAGAKPPSLSKLWQMFQK
ncbi:MAG: SDR family oxidoreductase [Candidatus Sericytochromatia bacterium]